MLLASRPPGAASGLGVLGDHGDAGGGRCIPHRVTSFIRFSQVVQEAPHPIACFVPRPGRPHLIRLACPAIGQQGPYAFFEDVEPVGDDSHPVRHRFPDFGGVRVPPPACRGTLPPAGRGRVMSKRYGMKVRAGQRAIAGCSCACGRSRVRHRADDRPRGDRPVPRYAFRRTSSGSLFPRRSGASRSRYRWCGLLRSGSVHDHSSARCSSARFHSRPGSTMPCSTTVVGARPFVPHQNVC